MKELKCPQCGNVFKVDEADYASIVSQVKTSEFDAEVSRRIAELNERYKAEQELVTAKAEQKFQSQLNKIEMELNIKDAEIKRLNTEKESEISKFKGEKESEMALLRSKLESIEAQKKSELAMAIAEKEQKIVQLNAAIEQSENKLQIAILEERNRAQETVQSKETEIMQLRNSVEQEKREAKIHETALMKQHDEKLRQQQELIDYYKDLKTKMSTKMVGETLEQHCSIQFEQYIRPIMQTAYFKKDNEISDGTKGDFIFRDFEDNIEYISIMFEMKNEMDNTSNKHKNEDFLKKLDEDRKKKGCEFAVLVSLLEIDNDLYNNGIVNKSHLYPKMYVIRPQFFIPFINLLVQTSKKSLEYKQQLIQAQSKEVDVTNFENKIAEFKSKFIRHYDNANKKFGEAIKQIDDTIAKLNKIKENLIGSENNLRLAQKDTDDLTIRKLTYNNPTMKSKFEEERNAREIKGADESIE